MPSLTARGERKSMPRKMSATMSMLCSSPVKDMDLRSKICRTMYVQHWNGMRAGLYKSRQTTCTVYDNVRAVLELRELDFQQKIKIVRTMMLPMMRH